MLVKRLDRATMPTLDASRNTGDGPGKAYETCIATRPIGHILVYGTPRPGCYGNRDRLPSRANVVARHAAPLAENVPKDGCSSTLRIFAMLYKHSALVETHRRSLIILCIPPVPKS